MSASASPPTAEVLIYEGVDELDAVGPFEVLAAAGLSVRTVALPAAAGAPAAVRGANGLALGVDGVLGVPDGAFGARPGVLVVPGGGWFDDGPGVRRLTRDPEVAARIAALHADGTILASVCTGALLLAATGVLRGRPAVTNRLALDDLRATGADVRGDARVVDDGDVLTAAGPLAGVDLAIRVVERTLGAAAAAAAAARLEHERVGPLVVAGEATA